MWLFRECGAPYIFMHSLWNPAIRWRHLEFKLKWGGKAEAITVKPRRPSVVESAAPPPYRKDYHPASFQVTDKKGDSFKTADYITSPRCGGNFRSSDFKMADYGHGDYINNNLRAKMMDYHGSRGDFKAAGSGGDYMSSRCDYKTDYRVAFGGNCASQLINL